MIGTGRDKIGALWAARVLGCVLSALLLGTTAGHAATITNSDSDTRTIPVTERGVRSEVVLTVGETFTFCNEGCFLVAPNGDHVALLGNESVDIVGGAPVINTP